jgi:hypothetical protein
MAHSIHISTARKMLDAGDPVDISFWTKDGELISLHDVVGLSYNFRSGTHNIKLLASRQIRTIRDICLYKINDMTIFL